jgi:hypothetical protein
MSDAYEIPEAEQCIGSNGHPSSRGTRTDRDGNKSGRCPACAGRFRMYDGILLAPHRMVADDEREDPNAY